LESWGIREKVVDKLTFYILVTVHVNIEEGRKERRFSVIYVYTRTQVDTSYLLHVILDLDEVSLTNRRQETFSVIYVYEDQVDTSYALPGIY